MTDTENGPDASGSWQPDPTGRYRLRWRGLREIETPRSEIRL